MSDSTLTRRGFLGVTGAATAALASGSFARADGANGRLAVGIVGGGGRGQGLLKTFFDLNKDHKADLVAVCDLWGRNRERAADAVKQSLGTQPKVFNRLEDLLGMQGLDAVLVATPDHAHARHLMACLQAGKHVYCEKPFANTLADANAALDACRKADKLVVTVGTQRRSDPRYQAAAQIMKSGVLGPVVRLSIVQNAYSPYRWRRDAEVKELRESDVDWKAFLVDKPFRKFDARQYLEFRLFHDFSTGIIDQWMTHMIDTVHLLTGAKFPRSVTAHGGTYAWKDHRENGDTVLAALEYEPGFLCTYSCSLANGFGSGCQILCREGTLEYEDRWRVSGDGVQKKGTKADEGKAIEPKDGVKTDMDHLHLADWLGCVRDGRRETNCTPEHGYQHAVACLMADRALHSGRRQVFDEHSRTIREG
jgi:predicted dehydrogenase